MPNKNYVRAAEYERDVAKKLVQDGALYATRTPGSRSPVDVIAVFPFDVGVKLLNVKTLTVHMIQCKLGKSRAKSSEIAFMKFMREKGIDAYYMTWRKSPKKKFHRLELEEVEKNAIDDGTDERAVGGQFTRHLPKDHKDKCGVHTRYGAKHRPRIKRGIPGCTCWELFGDRTNTGAALSKIYTKALRI